MTREVTVRIDRIIVEGVPESEANRIANDIRVELVRELRMPGAVDALVATAGTPGTRGGAPTRDGRDDGAAVTRQILGRPR